MLNISFNPVDPNTIANFRIRSHSGGAAAVIVKGFLELDIEAAEVTGWQENYKNVTNAAASVRNHIKHLNIQGVKAIYSGGKLYLVRI